jgi:hypothetical protein
VILDLPVPAWAFGPELAARLAALPHLPVYVRAREHAGRLWTAPLGTPDEMGPAWADLGPLGAGGRESDAGVLAVAVHAAWREAAR